MTRICGHRPATWSSSREPWKLHTCGTSSQGNPSTFGKCQTWASSTEARRCAKQSFPMMKLEHEVTVLGVVIQTTQKQNSQWSPDKTKKICREIALTGSLPCSMKMKELLISTKAIPQLNYTPHINAVPKDQLKLIQSAAARVLWKNRPTCRSRWMLRGVLCNPARSEPTFARAFRTITEVFSS